MDKNLGKKLINYPVEVFNGLIIQRRIYKKISELNVKIYESEEPTPETKLSDSDYSAFKVGGKWGHRYSCAWFEFSGELPNLDENKNYVALFNVGAEGLMFNSEKKPVALITNVFNVNDIVQSVMGKMAVPIEKIKEKDGKLYARVDAGNNNIIKPAFFKSKLTRADIVEVNQAYFDLYYDYLAVFALLLNENNKEKQTELKKALKKATSEIKVSVDEARKILEPYLKAEGNSDYTYSAIGHGHLDLAWLWPIRESKRKAARTLVNAFNNIENNDGFIMGLSQPQMMEWVKEDYPELFSKLKTYVENGRIELQGGMWVECDCNLTSGESLIRQIHYGQKFYKENFNKTVDNCWLPDAFGFNGNLPQILSKSGLNNFFTIKLSWNTVNKFPHTTFYWKGIDSSKVLAHIAPEGDYNSSASPCALKKGFDNWKEKEVKDAVLCFGNGDGGGGPGEIHFEMLKRDRNLKGLPKVELRGTKEFFDRLKNYENIPEYQGELYLEKHQGTFTSQGATKKNNRFMENSLHTLEFIGAVCSKDFPQVEVDELWKETLLYQFHDILPGSAIGRVYTESNERYEKMLNTSSFMQEKMMAECAVRGGVSAVNPTGFDISEIIKYKDMWYRVELPPYSAAPVYKEEVGSLYSLKSAEGGGIQNDKLTVLFSDDGSICCIKVEKDNFTLSGDINKLRVYPDKRLYYNAWDIDSGYVNKFYKSPELLTFRVFKEGASIVRENIYSYSHSKIIEKVYLKTGEDFVRVETTVNWDEKHKMLRAEFEANVFSDKVQCDIPFGYIERSTKNETSIEKAQFEIPAHKYINVDGTHYGYAIINNCKYGYRAKDGVISMNLLRSPKYPDKDCDIKKHTFGYLIYPHKEKLEESKVYSYAYRFNNPAILLSATLNIPSFVKSTNPKVIIETVKPSYGGDGYVLRVYNNSKDKQTAGVVTKSNTAMECDLQENPIKTVSLKELIFEPFEIKTFKI